MKNIQWVLLIFITLSIQLQAQQVYHFKKGLAIGPCHSYGREAIYTDHLAYQLFNTNSSKPAEGQVLFTNEKGKNITWKSIEANNEDKFKDSTVSNGYLYFTYDSDKDQVALLNITSNSMVYFNETPHTGDIYGSGWVYIPVQVKKGLNELYIRGSRFSFWEGIKAKLIFPEKPVTINTEDPTLPHILLGKQAELLWAAVVVINATTQPLALQLKNSLEGKEILSNLPIIPPMTARKVGFRIDASAIIKKGTYNNHITILQKGVIADEKEIKLDAVEAGEYYSNTFISEIDGSVQYYSVAPQTPATDKPSALFLSVHGAGVEAIGQARAYKPKDFGVLVAPTNRRPRGFNWEDWGRLDALEVLEIAKQKFNINPYKIYLTGHSMGGHGTWYLGATFPGKWAAIAPCAGYPTLSAYGSADGKIPGAAQSKVESLLLQASNSSNVLELAQNYKSTGIYIHHGDDDKVVPVTFARQMRELLGTFHNDFSYYEYPGGSHWFGNESVDWQPIFDYFKWHSIPVDSTVNNINFSTASPAISSQYHWVSIIQQQQSLKYSRVQLHRNKALKTISGSTENISVLSISTDDFKKGDTIQLKLDGESIKYAVSQPKDILYFHKDNLWKIGSKPSLVQKGTNRNGTFKEPFNRRMVFVYGTTGNAEENAWAYAKARYDAEVWYYRGNGSVDIVADKNFTSAAFKDRGIIIYGNASTNSAWKKLLNNCPIQAKRGSITIGATQYNGGDLAAYFMWPRADSDIASVAVITGSGLKGMRAAEANQYFAAGSGFPDYMIFSIDLLKGGVKGIKEVGFYGNDWSLDKGQRVVMENIGGEF